jgi:mRNA interferase HicA
MRWHSQHISIFCGTRVTVSRDGALSVDNRRPRVEDKTLQKPPYMQSYGHGLTAFERKRWLARQGAVFSEGSNHTKIKLNGRQSVMPRHPSAEVREGLRRPILKQLGIK